MPSGDQFADLVDSTLNIMDEGFDKTRDDGLKVAQLGSDGKLFSFYKESLTGDPLYFVAIDQADNLILSNGVPGNVLFLSEGRETGQRVRVGINNADPASELDVVGVIRAEGRIGVTGKLGQQELEVPADGDWHNITGPLNGCHAYEVMAGVGGRRREGRYALLHAFAVNAFNPRGPIFNFLNLKKRIRYQPAYYRSRSDKLRLRWRNGEDRNYYLQLKSNSSYGDGAQVRYYLTRLWFDEDMSGSWGGS